MWNNVDKDYNEFFMDDHKNAIESKYTTGGFIIRLNDRLQTGIYIYWNKGEYD